jgi:hypothetical protein
MANGTYDTGASGIRRDKRSQAVQEKIHKVQEDSFRIGLDRVLDQPLSHRRNVMTVQGTEENNTFFFFFFFFFLKKKRKQKITAHTGYFIFIWICCRVSLAL